MQYLGAIGGHFEHLVVRDTGDLLGVRLDSRVGGEDAVDIAVDLADIGVQRGRQSDRRCVRSTTAQCRDVLTGLRNTLKTSNDRDRSLRQCGFDPAGRDIDDLGTSMP